MLPVLPAIISAIPSIIKLFDSDERKQGVKELTGQAINEAGKALGLQFSSQDELINHLNANPIEVLKLKQLESDTQLEMEKVGLLIIEAVNETMQSESKSDHWLQYAWRPFIGMNFGLYIGSLWLLPLFGKAPSVLDQNIIMAITAILGVASYFRGQEKVKKAK
jgi:hypothetical protein